MWDGGIQGKKERRNGEENNRRRTNYHNKKKKSVWCLAGLWNLSYLRSFTAGNILVQLYGYVAYMSLASVWAQDCHSCFHSQDGLCHLFRDVILWIFLNRDCSIGRGGVIDRGVGEIVMHSSNHGSWPKGQKSNFFFFFYPFFSFLFLIFLIFGFALLPPPYFGLLNQQLLWEIFTRICPTS